VLIDKVFILAAVVFAGILCQWFAWRVKLPAILFLLFAGIIGGPLTGWLDSDALFGDLLFPFISLSVAVILFEGSLTLRFHQISGLERGGPQADLLRPAGHLADHRRRHPSGP
jgi:NhaP-type Na+/H+ or K+/H+ antiporter